MSAGILGELCCGTRCGVFSPGQDLRTCPKASPTDAQTCGRRNRLALNRPLTRRRKKMDGWPREKLRRVQPELSPEGMAKAIRRDARYCGRRSTPARSRPVTCRPMMLDDLRALRVR